MHAVSTGSCGRGPTTNYDRNGGHKNSSQKYAKPTDTDDWERRRNKALDMVIIRNKYTKEIVDLEVSLFIVSKLDPQTRYPLEQRNCLHTILWLFYCVYNFLDCILFNYHHL